MTSCHCCRLLRRTYGLQFDWLALQRKQICCGSRFSSTIFKGGELSGLRKTGDAVVVLVVSDVRRALKRGFFFFFFVLLFLVFLAGDVGNNHSNTSSLLRVTFQQSNLISL